MTDQFMYPPKDAKVLENQSSIMWFDENGILCSVSKKSPAMTIEESKATIEDFTKFTEGKKVCMLSDSTHSTPPNKEMRDWVATVLPDLVNAVAVVSKSAVGIMIANLFFSIKRQPYPIKMFDNVEEAKAWLKQYL